MALCDSAKLLSSTLDASLGAALLLSSDGEVLHKNFHASVLLLSDHEPVDGEKRKINLSHWVKPPNGSESWSEELEKLSTNDNNGRETLQCTLTQKDLDVTVSLSRLPACPCCQSTLVSAYLRSETSRLSVDEVSALQLDRDLVDASFDPMVAIDEEGAILMVNEATVRAFGYTQSELLHKNISMLCGGDHGANHDKYMQRYLATGETKIVGKVRKVPARRKDGSEFSVELGIKQVKSADGIHKRMFVGYMKDMTMAEKHEQELLRKESLMQCMIDASFDPMFQCDEKGIIIMVNNAAVQLFCFEREEFLGHNISMICGKEHADRHDSYLERYLKTGEKRILGRKRTVQARRKDGSEFDIELGLQEVISEDNGERRFCGYIRDITARRMMQKELRKRDKDVKSKFFEG